MKKKKWLHRGLPLILILILLTVPIMRKIFYSEADARRFYHVHERQLTELQALARTPELKKYSAGGNNYMIPELGFVQVNYMEEYDISFITVYIQRWPFADIVLFTDPGGVEDINNTYIDGGWYANIPQYYS